MANAIVEGIQALIDRYQAAKAEARNRGAVVQMDADGQCDRCGRPIFEGALAAWYPQHEKLACADCAGLDELRQTA